MRSNTFSCGRDFTKQAFFFSKACFAFTENKAVVKTLGFFVTAFVLCQSIFSKSFL